jgi:hypothetical protein
MIRHRLLISAIGVGLAIAPTIVASPVPQERRERAAREYHFREGDAQKLRDHYRANFRENDRIEAAHRARFVVGGRLPGDWKVRIHPVPEVVLRELPAIPAGLEIGYLDGYTVVYDPATLDIVEVLDVWPN